MYSISFLLRMGRTKGRGPDPHTLSCPNGRPTTETGGTWYGGGGIVLCFATVSRCKRDMDCVERYSFVLYQSLVYSLLFSHYKILITAAGILQSCTFSFTMDCKAYHLVFNNAGLHLKVTYSAGDVWTPDGRNKVCLCLLRLALIFSIIAS